MALIRLGPQAWLVAYDIADPLRLGRVGRWVRTFAMPVQYSLYLGRINDTDVELLAAGIEQRIKAAVDDVRIYHLPALLHVDSIGRALADAGLVDFAPLAQPVAPGAADTPVIAGLQCPP